jgi:peroxiredoxin
MAIQVGTAAPQFTLPDQTGGVIRSTVWIGPDGKVKRHWARVAKAEAHPAEVLAALRAGT